MSESGPPADPSSKTVLIVDDDDSILTLLDILIHRDGFKIELAATGEEALRKLPLKPDVLLLDLMLPGATGGFEVLKYLRASAGPQPPVIVITAVSENKPEIQTLSKDPLVAAVFHKPIHQEKLLSLLHRVLNTRPPQRPDGKKG